MLREQGLQVICIKLLNPIVLGRFYLFFFFSLVHGKKHFLSAQHRYFYLGYFKPNL